MGILKIDTVSTFIEAIKKVGTKPNADNYFRGHSDKSFQLVPGIYREDRIKFEDKAFKEMTLRVPHEFADQKSAIENLVKMQHYGLPTRLLDITSNPLVALYFACVDSENKNGEVVFLQIPKSHIKFYDSDTVSFLANIAKQPPDFHPDFHANKISVFNDQIYLHLLLHSIRDEKPHYQPLINPKHMEDVFAVKVKLGNSRILKQNGAFLIFGIHSSKLYPAKLNYGWQTKKIGGDEFIVPKNSKQNLLYELDLMGINQSSLFPEIDYQADYLVQSMKFKTGPFR